MPVNRPAMMWVNLAALEHPTTGQLLPLDGELLVGRSSQCRLRLPDRKISSVHAQLRWNGERWCVRDLGSRNGTYINGDRIQSGDEQPLRNGDALAFAGAKPVWKFVEEHSNQANRIEATLTESSMIRAVELVFTVSRDEEHVDLEARWAGQVAEIGSRAHCFMLLTLARIRLEDQKSNLLPVSEHGWVHVDDLCRMLRVESSHLNVDVHRARRDLEQASVPEFRHVVERRRTARQLRIGFECLRIESA